jgi:hypothetical protein
MALDMTSPFVSRRERIASIQIDGQASGEATLRARRLGLAGSTQVEPFAIRPAGPVTCVTVVCAAPRRR